MSTTRLLKKVKSCLSKIGKIIYVDWNAMEKEERLFIASLHFKDPVDRWNYPYIGFRPFEQFNWKDRL